HVILGWGQGASWGAKLSVQFASHGPVPMIGFTTSRGWPHPYEAITPLAVANGKGDDYLAALNAAIAAWAKPVSGRFKGAAHATPAYRKAFARIYLLLHGGTADQLSARLRVLGLPGVTHDYQPNPKPTLRVVWNPQGYGSPNLPGNSAQA